MHPIDAKAVGGSYFGEGDLPILLSDVQCKGDETYVSYCDANIGYQDCGPDKTAGVICVPES